MPAAYGSAVAASGAGASGGDHGGGVVIATYHRHPCRFVQPSSISAGSSSTSPFEAFARYEEANGLPAGFLRAINARNPDDNAWARLERSEVDMAGFCELFEAEALAAGHAVSGSDVLGLLAGELRPEMVEAVRRCAAQLRTGLLTNNFVGMRSANRQHPFHEVLDLFDEIVESSQVGVRKPDPRFYEHACERLAIDTERGRLPRRPRREPQAGTRHGHDHHQGRRSRGRARRARAGRRLPLAGA